MPKETFHNLPEEKKGQFINAALEEFAGNNFDTASVTRIVKKLGIAKGSVYQYFEDKLELWLYLKEYCEGVKMSYVPSQFSPGPATPYRWKQPWFTPRQSFGGEMMVLLPDGAVISLPHLMQYDYRSPKAEE